jgi:hypothetical protein
MRPSPTRGTWQKRIDRVSALAARDDATRPLLDLYRRLLLLQADCDATICAQTGHLTGSLERDLALVRSCARRLLHEVSDFGPPGLVEQGRLLLEDGESAIDSMLLEEWRAPTDRSFFAKVLLQPYAHCLASGGIRPLDRNLPHRNGTCPFCAGAPLVSVLHHAADDDPGGRDLVCGTCFTSWPFRRVLCAHCGEDDEAQLGYFHSPSYDHVRIDACERCKRYLKSIDLTRLGFAVPVVDEVAAAPLDLWARERGYQKIELNLVGL